MEDEVHYGSSFSILILVGSIVVGVILLLMGLLTGLLAVRLIHRRRREEEAGDRSLDSEGPECSVGKVAFCLTSTESLLTAVNN